MSTIKERLALLPMGLISKDGVQGGVGLDKEFSFLSLRWIGRVSVKGSWRRRKNRMVKAEVDIWWTGGMA